MFENQKFARKEEQWLKYTVAQVDGEKRKVTIGYHPGHQFAMSDDIDNIRPKARVY